MYRVSHKVCIGLPLLNGYRYCDSVFYAVSISTLRMDNSMMLGKKFFLDFFRLQDMLHYFFWLFSISRFIFHLQDMLH